VIATHRKQLTGCKALDPARLREKMDHTLERLQELQDRVKAAIEDVE
jgi:hypothetical protein